MAKNGQTGNARALVMNGKPLWNDFAKNTRGKRRGQERPGLSLLERGEIAALEGIAGDHDLLARTLLVKAVFGGTIVAEAESGC